MFKALLASSSPFPAGHLEKAFVLMVAVSMLIHSLVAISLFTGQRQGAMPAPATYIDLRMIREESPPTAPLSENIPAEKAAPDVAPPLPPKPQSATDALQQQMAEALSAAQSRPQAVHNVSFGLGMASGYFNSLGEGRTLRPEIREYYLSLLEKVNETWWGESRGQSGWAAGAVINVLIARDGTLLDLQLAQSSGNLSRDRAIVQALRNSSPFPPLPDGYADNSFKAPLRFVAPLNMMAPALSGSYR
jgi:periplasmic protein TonB